MKAMIFKRRWGRTGIALACGRLFVAVTATLGVLAAFWVPSAAAGLLVPRAEKSQTITPHVAEPAGAPAHSEPTSPSYVVTPEAPSPATGAPVPSERSAAHRARRPHRHRALLGGQVRAGLVSRALRRLTKLAAEGSCNVLRDWLTCSGDNVGGGGDGGFGGGNGASGGGDGSGDDGLDGWDGGDDSTDADNSCPWAAICWDETDSTDTGDPADSDSDTGEPCPWAAICWDETDSTDTGDPADSDSDTGEPCPWAAICWDEPDPEPVAEPEPQAQPKPEPAAKSPANSTADPIRLKPEQVDEEGDRSHCGIAYRVLGRADVPGAPSVLGPGTKSTDCVGDPQLIPICSSWAPDGASCADGEPALPRTLDAYKSAQDACIWAQQSEEELQVLEEIAAAFSVDTKAVGLAAIHQRSRATWNANQCDRIWRGYR